MYASGSGIHLMRSFLPFWHASCPQWLPSSFLFVLPTPVPGPGPLWYRIVMASSILLENQLSTLKTISNYSRATSFRMKILNCLSIAAHHCTCKGWKLPSLSAMLYGLVHFATVMLLRMVPWVCRITIDTRHPHSCMAKIARACMRRNCKTRQFTP